MEHPKETESRRRFAGPFLLLCLCVLSIRVELAMADSVRGYVDLTYNRFTTETRDQSGETSRTESSGFKQRYNFMLEKNLYPHLFLNAGGLFEYNRSELSSEETRTRLTSTQYRPFADLTLRTPLYTAGVLYSRRRTEDKASGSPSVAQVNQEYDGVLGWRPEGFPSLDMRFERVNIYDEARAFQDTASQRLFLNLIYTLKDLDLRYRGSYDDTDNRIDRLEIKNISHNGILSYSRSFFDRRASLYSNYNVSWLQTETISSGQGEVSTQHFPFAGLSSLDDSPAEGALDPNPTVVDGTLNVGSGVDIGLPAIGEDTRPRNIGVDFFNESQVNTLDVWVDRELPSGIAGSFSWDIYTSSDNITWTLRTTVSSAPFGVFQNRFQIDFPSVTARYIKVVTRPLSAVVPGAADFPDILVTEIQAFLRKPAQGAGGKTTGLSQILNVDLRTRLLEKPFLYYELSYFLSKQESSVRTRSTLSNGLSLTHRFNPVFSANARVAREDTHEGNDDGLAYVYNASVRADPLATLSHTLMFSGRDEKFQNESVKRNALFLQNTAELYKGIDIFLHGGYSVTSAGMGEIQQSTILNLGATAVPHRSLTVTLNYGDTRTDTSGGGKPDQSNVNRRGDLSMSYRPFQTLYLIASVGRLIQDDRKYTLKNYAVNWSPFPYGTLQFNFAYNEELTSQNQGRDRTIRPSMRWNITNRIFVDASYQMIKSRSTAGTTDVRAFTANMQMRY